MQIKKERKSLKKIFANPVPYPVYEKNNRILVSDPDDKIFTFTLAGLILNRFEGNSLKNLLLIRTYAALYNGDKKTPF